MIAVLDIARGLVAARLSIVPIKRDGSKAPAVGSWKPYQSRLATDGELVGWYKRPEPPGIAVVSGAVSGEVELIDFDKRAEEIFPAWCELVEAERPGLVAKLSVVRTPRPGFHVRYRCSALPDGIPGNQKLAVDPALPADDRVLVETRGKHGYAIVPGTPLECHKDRRPYEHVGGPPLTALVDITPGDREVLIRCARSFNLSVADAPAGDGAKAAGDQLRPGDDFNRRGTSIADQIEAAGWKRVQRAGNAIYWLRPGKEGPGWSATTGYCTAKDGRELFAVFSTNVPPFPGGDADRDCSVHDRFAVYALLKHGGDFKAAAKQLAAEGYGEKGPRVTVGKPSAGGHPSGNGHADAITVGPFVLRPGKPRQTAAGMVRVSVEAVRNGISEVTVNVSTNASSLESPAKLLAQLDPAVDRGDARVALAKVVGRAAATLAADKSKPAGPTLREVVTAVADAYQLRHRIDRGTLWSESQGREIGRAEFVTNTPNWLMDRAGVAVDAPIDATGAPVRADLLRALRSELECLWADLLASLPRAENTDLGVDTEAARKFREAMVRLWSKTQTFEVTRKDEGDRAARASLVSRVQTAFRPYLTGVQGLGRREGWREVQHAFAAWWRPHEHEGELMALLALRWEIVGQVGVELPGVSDQPSLCKLGEQFGILDPKPPAPAILSGGKVRLAVLSLSLSSDLLAMPAADPIEEDHGDAYEGDPHKKETP